MQEKIKNNPITTTLVEQKWERPTGIIVSEKDRYINASMDEIPEPIKGYCLEWCKKPQEIVSPLIMGATGTGKTYLFHALGRMLREGHLSTDTTIKLINSTDLVCEIKNAIPKNETDSVITYYKKASILMIDDMGADRITDYTRELVYIILDYRYNWCLPTPMTTNFDLPALKDLLGERITSRIIGMTKQFVMQGKDRRLTPATK